MTTFIFWKNWFRRTNKTPKVVLPQLASFVEWFQNVECNSFARVSTNQCGESNVTVTRLTEVTLLIDNNYTANQLHTSMRIRYLSRAAFLFAGKPKEWEIVQLLIALSPNVVLVMRITVQFSVPGVFIPWKEKRLHLLFPYRCVNQVYRAL